MLLWTTRSRAVLLVVFAVVVLVVFVAPIATVIAAALAGSWTGPLPSDLGLRHFDAASSGEKRPTTSRSPNFSTAMVSAPVGSTTSTGADMVAMPGLPIVLGLWRLRCSGRMPSTTLRFVAPSAAPL